MDEIKIRKLWEEKRKEIMKEVRRTGFGQSETQVSVFSDEIRLATHPTPSYTQYRDMKDCIFAFDVPWDHFTSYDQVDEMFEEAFENYKNEKEMEKVWDEEMRNLND
jgi:hypothetical protein